MNERADGSDDGQRVANGYQEPAFDMHKLDERTLRRLTQNDADVAALCVYDYSSDVFEQIEDSGERVGAAISNSRQLQKLYLAAFPRATRSLIALFQGIARNRSIRHLVLSDLDVSEVDIFAIMSPFFEQNVNLRCVEILCTDMSTSPTFQERGGHFDQIDNVPPRVSSLILAMSTCNHLERIRLCHNNYGYPGPTQVIDSLYGHQNLLELKLQGSELLMYDLANFLSHSQSKILSLELGDVDLDDESIVLLADSLIENKSIKKFSVFQGTNDVTATGWKAFSAFLRHSHCSLEILSLEASDMDDEGVFFFGNSLSLNKTIKQLSLSCNSFITSAGWRAIANSLRNPNSVLEGLNINKCFYRDDESDYRDDESDEGEDQNPENTGLDDDGAIVLAESLAKNSSLKKLDMSCSLDITSEGWAAFFAILLDSQFSLEALDLSYNFIDHSGAAVLVHLLASMTNLHTLFLRGNDFGVHELREYTRFLQPTSMVTTLDLAENHFNDEVVIEFAEAIAKNTILEILIIGGAEVTDRSWAALSCALCDESSIETMYSSNHTLHTIKKIHRDIRATIPEDLTSLLHLNKIQDKKAVARQKIIQRHFCPGKINIEFFDCMSTVHFPCAIEWIGRDEFGFSLLYDIVLAFPSKISRGGNAINVQVDEDDRPISLHNRHGSYSQKKLKSSQ
jgi:Ran GTPase-activating protein (RanGAP) involved in mRNA processing and transport